MTHRPVAVRTSTEHRSGVVLVACLIDNDTSEPRGVRLVNRLDGPTLPPRRRGRAVDGWTDATYTTVVGPMATRAVGYACVTDDTTTPPAAVTAVGAPTRIGPEADRP